MCDRVGPIEYDVETNTYRVEYDPAVVAPSVAVITVLETLVDDEPAALTPLYEVIDPEGFDRLLSNSRGQRDRTLSVSFRYQGFRVTAFANGTVEVQPIDGPTSEA